MILIVIQQVRTTIPSPSVAQFNCLSSWPLLERNFGSRLVSTWNIVSPLTPFWFGMPLTSKDQNWTLTPFLHPLPQITNSLRNQYCWPSITWIQPLTTTHWHTRMCHLLPKISKYSQPSESVAGWSSFSPLLSNMLLLSGFPRRCFDSFWMLSSMPPCGGLIPLLRVTFWTGFQKGDHKSSFTPRFDCFLFRISNWADFLLVGHQAQTRLICYRGGSFHSVFSRTSCHSPQYIIQSQGEGVCWTPGGYRKRTVHIGNESAAICWPFEWMNNHWWDQHLPDRCLWLVV